MDESLKKEDKSKTSFAHFKAPPVDTEEDGSAMEPSGEPEIIEAIRCIKVSPDGATLAAGDLEGNIRIYDLTEAEDVKLVKLIEAHDKEIICLAYSPNLSENGAERYWLASGSRDKLITIFDSSYGYEAIGLLPSHLQTVTSVAFREVTVKSIGGLRKTVQLFTSGADRLLTGNVIDSTQLPKDLEDLQMEDDLFIDEKNVHSSEKMFSMGCAERANVMVTGHERELKLWSLPNLQPLEWEQTQMNPATQIKVAMDPTASIIITSGTDKRVTIVEASSGRTICQAKPGQITTAMCLSNNKKHLITTSDHGIIFVWKLPTDLTTSLRSIEAEQKKENYPLTVQTDQEDRLQISSMDNTIVAEKKQNVNNMLNEIADVTKLIGGLNLPAPIPDRYD
jgi:WD40 repeat protein